ncbi:hypothetical protein [Lagierella massiliensis]|uniref:hypothetical protein n=1 Tax=Lagierella massiliensis TaxID=1689303 RepID=UPI0012E1152A|nr:hypothetical protein [Lagierella massiliensis]
MVETQEKLEEDLFICLQDIQILREKLKMYERDLKELERLSKIKKELIGKLAEYD